MFLLVSGRHVGAQCTWAPAWRLHTNLYKFGENVSSHIFHEKNCCDLNLGESLCTCTFFLFPDSGLNLLNGFDFLFWSILNGVTLKTSNRKEVGYSSYLLGVKNAVLVPLWVFRLKRSTAFAVPFMVMSRKNMAGDNVLF